MEKTRTGEKILVFSVVSLIFLVLSGCAGTGGTAGAPPVSVVDAYYPAGGMQINAEICQPPNASMDTPRVVLTGGDGVDVQKLRPACEAFARAGFVALAHDNVNGSVEQNVQAVVGGIDYLSRGRPSRKVGLWAHSAGTIFAAFAAFMRPAQVSAFVETSGHMQIPICDTPNGVREPDCLAYWSEFPAPIMIVHGLNDTVVDPTYAQAFNARLERMGKAHRMQLVEGKGHEFMMDVPGVVAQEAQFFRSNGGSG
ncbi:MAG: prolyl oligopeptidase family serine peptidase [Candidatus Micrarchaeota archaeon]